MKRTGSPLSSENQKITKMIVEEDPWFYVDRSIEAHEPKRSSQSFVLQSLFTGNHFNVVIGLNPTNECIPTVKIETMDGSSSISFTAEEWYEFITKLSSGQFYSFDIGSYRIISESDENVTISNKEMNETILNLNIRDVFKVDFLVKKRLEFLTSLNFHEFYMNFLKIHINIESFASLHNSIHAAVEANILHSCPDNWHFQEYFGILEIFEFHYSQLYKDFQQQQIENGRFEISAGGFAIHDVETFYSPTATERMGSSS